MAMRRTYQLGPSGGAAVELAPGQRLRVIDTLGGQVVDMAVFNLDNPREKLSTSYSRSRWDPAIEGSFHPRDRLSVGDYLMSTLNREMLRITADTPAVKGMHDVHGRMCNRRLYRSLGREEQDGCHEIITAAVADYGLLAEDIPDTMDLFMNYHHDCTNGWWVIEDGVSGAGDYIEFEAVMNCLVALSNCPFFDGTAIEAQVLEAVA
ncbi:MAG: urea carboxylase-associated family protein [Alphaproteobacteria bacterium]|jgi:hypothetical protein|nr:urea carboxylase-associated family protein [Alphaproteobacteria bacterium]MDP6567873.1 urea carboxylase-associated family protein [Alphaproteobacteria bacterium]MDP6813121.1 urea carboxylase-associated family protein [Alphaproteobacteria bacterium]